MKAVKIILALWACSGLFASAEGMHQDHEVVRQAVLRFVQDQVGVFRGNPVIAVGPLDTRLLLAYCPALEPFVPPGGKILGRGTVGVRCSRPEEGAGWTIYVPVQVSLKSTLVMARTILSAERVLTAEDLVEQVGEITQPDTLTDLSQAIGKVVRQGIGAGQVIRQEMLRNRYVIRQGEPVQVQVQGTGFKVMTEGQAMSNAAEGQSVQIRMASGRLITGTANGSGVVGVTP